MSRKDLLGVLAVAIVSLVALVVGWHRFWFLCDDAFIAFRYVSNSQFGYGYTWNPPPFQPVEGYTSFLWVVTLDVAWRVFGVEPPDSANGISLLFSMMSTTIVGAMAWRVKLSEGFSSRRLAVLALTLFAVITNRTWLAWTSSGLETAMETLFLLAWVYIAVFGAPTRGRALALSMVASGMALCRPDGLLYVAATVALIGGRLLRKGWREFIGFAPLLLVVGHLIWRRYTYGFWLPNTYYAKHVAPWPLAGSHYVLSFAMEYFYWIWVAMAVVFLARQVLNWRDSLEKVRDESFQFHAVAVGTVVCHWAYYTFRVGGDHFEYRIYHHLVPLIVLSTPWLASRLGWTPRASWAAWGGMTTLGLLIPWVLWWNTSWKLDLPKDERHLTFPIAALLPFPLSLYGAAFDASQGFLIDRFVAMRWNSHAYYARYKQMPKYPTREQGLRIDGTDFPVFVIGGVGVPGWVMPHVAIIDKYGLNDVVIAHSPPIRTSETKRHMAHDRRPPKGYVECFRPNVTLGGPEKLRFKIREKPLTADDVRACEQRWRRHQVVAGARVESEGSLHER